MRSRNLLPVSTAALALAFLSPVTPGPATADTPPPNLTPHQQTAEDLLRELIAFETTSERPEENLRAFEAVAAHLRAAGFDDEDIRIVNPYPDTWGLVVRYRGRSPADANRKPVLAIAHMDVVTATPDAWAFAPFSLGVKDGYYLGRGTADNKTGVVQIFANFMRLKQEGWVPGRDLIAAITGDEETQMKMADWFASEASGLTEAEYVLNSDGGGGELNDAREPVAFWVQTSEKVYQTWDLVASNEGGHSSVPRPDNAIQDLALAITRLAENPFPVMLDDNMRMMYRRAATLYPEPMRSDMLTLADAEDLTAPAAAEAAARIAAASPTYNAELRTTCTPTMLRGGHAENALPRDAVVTVNCRILPGTPVSEVQAHIEGLVDDLGIELLSVYDGIESPPSFMSETFLAQLETLVAQHWEGPAGEVPVIPAMSTGATDGLFYRNAGIPVFGVAALFQQPDEDRSHGLDEKVGVKEFHDSVAFWYDLLKTVGD